VENVIIENLAAVAYIVQSKCLAFVCQAPEIENTKSKNK
jgi:hypothetical protein